MFSKFPSFIKIPKYKSYNLTPRYYDPVKEERQKREERIKAELKREQTTGEIDKYSHINIREFYRNKKSMSRMGAQRQSNGRILLIFIALVLIVYIIFR